MKRPVRQIPDLLKDWDRIEEKIRGNGRVTVFLDFDGTLVDIAPRPELVHLTPVARKTLRRLARHPNATLVVVSGRRRPELLEHIGIPGIHYFGLYGWESNTKSSLPARVRKALRRARVHLKPLLNAYPDVWIENKSSSLSVHLLDVPVTLQPRVRRELRISLLPFRKTLHAVGNIRDAESCRARFQAKEWPSDVSSPNPPTASLFPSTSATISPTSPASQRSAVAYRCW